MPSRSDHPASKLADAAWTVSDEIPDIQTVHTTCRRVLEARLWSMLLLRLDGSHKLHESTPKCPKERFVFELDDAENKWRAADQVSFRTAREGS